MDLTLFNMQKYRTPCLVSTKYTEKCIKINALYEEGVDYIYNP